MISYLYNCTDIFIYILIFLFVCKYFYVYICIYVKIYVSLYRFWGTAGLAGCPKNVKMMIYG